MSAFKKSYQSSLTAPKESVILLYMKREVLVFLLFTIPIYKSFVFSSFLGEYKDGDKDGYKAC